ncbi:hypothetical protein [Acinetobacter nosocomialis]|uniref:hypothetical protein n=1 Tax=Acinetobacter nosocomialis TaxID=106654 RepID=UPI0026EA5B7B|nr:hypothetical protein [Acinetobacter nosocomialis]MDO7219869.1 hypothetical protein [Acinetobacter nosocomialis]
MMRLIFVFLTIGLISSCYAKNIAVPVLNKNEINLKNFGFSYCLSKSDNEAVAREASLAMGGYFQNGGYDENAYKNIKLFIEKGSTESKDVYQSTGKPAILMNCLKLYNSNKYEQVIQNQKKYIIN